MKVILASASPRRRELLAQIGIEALVHPVDFAEAAGGVDGAQAVARANAVGKCQEAVSQLGDELPVVAADTLVELGGAVLGKPKDSREAALMLEQLSGRSHKVMTGIAVGFKGRLVAKVVETEVFFRTLDRAEIEAYVATGEPLDKAGAYGIQGKGAVLVAKINGSYSNVVGLPLAELYVLLKEIMF